MPGCADRLSVLVTLFLALYTHKGVVVEQVNTMQTTSIEWVMIFGYFCMFFQACVIVLASPSTPWAQSKTDDGDDDGPDGPWVLGPRDAWYLQLTFLGLMVIVLFIYFLRARLHASLAVGDAVAGPAVLASTAAALAAASSSAA